MRIAIVGAGISGLFAAYLLSRAGHKIVVFEAATYAGGHSNTVVCEIEGMRLPIDTGFIVHNDRTYPNFFRLMDELGVATQATEMSFSVTDERTGLAYNGHSLTTLFAQPSNLINPSFYGMIRDILRFNRDARAWLAEAPQTLTLGEFLDRQGYGKMLRDQYVLPMGAAIWSSQPGQITAFPATAFLRFFENHGLLNLEDRPQWRVIVGGSRRYVDRLSAPFRSALRLALPVKFIRRGSDAVQVRSFDDTNWNFDHVVLACHSDQALPLLADPSPEEREILSAIPYAENEAVLHTDRRMLPPLKRAWAAWNYRIPAQAGEAAAVTYNQNILQNFATRDPVCVTLNRTQAIAPERVIRRLRYHHPQYSERTLSAQRRHGEISGMRRTHYCGAYWGWGFHEDGVNSALRVARGLGVRW